MFLRLRYGVSDNTIMARAEHGENYTKVHGWSRRSRNAGQPACFRSPLLRVLRAIPDEGVRGYIFGCGYITASVTTRFPTTLP